MSKTRKDSLIDTLLKLSGFDDEYILSIEGQFTVLQNRYQLNQSSLEKIAESYGGGKLRDRVIAIYKEEFEESQIEEAISFWSSPIGKSLTSKQFKDKQKKLGAEWAYELERAFSHEFSSYKKGDNNV